MSEANLYHVDVFASAPLTGNGLTVFLDTALWSGDFMQNLTQEMRQFESIFLSEISEDGARARIFTVEEELAFAGHPVLGAAAVLHRTMSPLAEQSCWTIRLTAGDFKVTTRNCDDHYLCEMNQGVPKMGLPVNLAQLRPILHRLNLEETDLFSTLPAQVVSTGLHYLIIPVTAEGLAKTKTKGDDLEVELAKLQAKFVFVLDVENRELRTWDNLGLVEDIATGSAAGPATAFLIQHGLAQHNTRFELAQGRFLGRPSKISVMQHENGDVLVSGEVWPVSAAVLEITAR